MKSLKLVAGAIVLAALAGCQNGASGVSTYGGSLETASASSTSAPTRLQKAGKERRTDSQGNIYYVNKYVRVPAHAKPVRTAYAPKPTAKKAAPFASILKTKPQAKKVVRGKGDRGPKKTAVANKKIDALIVKHARANGVPVKLARAVVKIESNGRVNARGAAGEIGLMQLMPRTARGIGYKGKLKNLYNPDTNLAYGMKYLGEAYRRGGKTPCGAVLKYNAGHYAKKWNPTSRKYCTRVKKILRKG